MPIYSNDLNGLAYSLEWGKLICKEIVQNIENDLRILGANMPLKKGAKPGTKGFGDNIKAELNAGKPKSQAIAIAYSEAKAKKKKK